MHLGGASGGPDIASAVRAWAALHPNAPALIDGDVTLSRAALLRWCEIAAVTLRSRRIAGAGPALCALLLPRSWAVPFGLIAARFAGLAFLPLDPAQPAARLGSILAQARPTCARVEGALHAAGLHPAASPVLFDPPDPALERLVLHRVADAGALPPGTGHVVFTSGSTGRPKGVILRDGPLLQTVAAQRGLLGTDGTGPDATAASVWALNPGFDASLSDIFCALLGTAPLLVFREEQTRWRSLAAAIARHGAARADLAPSLLRLVPPQALGLTALIFGGERCDPATAERWGRATLALQAYGPTEAAVCATMARAGPGWRDGELGRPLPHQIVLLATEQAVFRVAPRVPQAGPGDAEAFNATVLVSPDAPESATGEIWLAGDAIASRYLDAPDMEAERFGVWNGRRIHRTGDIARWSDGRLVWLGRRDRQIKVNGRLVCPEEIEAVAGGCWGGPCACIPGERGLVLALGGTSGAAPAAVLTAIAGQLGTALTPRRAVLVAAWPLLPNGKTDLAALHSVTAKA
jgi:non-ribosomal peptide synthetase component F